MSTLHDTCPVVEIPEIKHYDCEEDMLYDIELSENEGKFEGVGEEKIPEPPIKVEDISCVSDLLLLIEYIKDNKLQYKNPYFKIIVKTQESLKKLDNMIGMKTIKKTIANQVIYLSKIIHKGIDKEAYSTLNAALYGPPGSGKTTVAYIIRDIYSTLGITRNDKFIIGKLDNMKGQYVGQTAPTTLKILNSARGGILFLDEVYQFGNGEKKDTFSKEIIDTITQFITDPDNFNNDILPPPIIIIAGYKEQTEKDFFSINSGLRRRFRWIFNIDKYVPEDLVKIFYKQAHDLKYEITSDILKLHEHGGKRKSHLCSNAVKFFTEHKDMFVYGGGDTDIFLQKCIMINVKRTICDQKDEYKLNDIDIMKGFKEYESYIMDRKTKKEKEKEKELSDDIKYSMYV